VDAATVLLREYGLLDAKELVRADASILLAAADKAQAIREAEAAERAAALLAAELPAGWGPRDIEEEETPAFSFAAAAAAPSKVASVIEAIRRSPLMLELEPTHTGLAAIAGMPDDLVVDAVTYLVREVGWADAKAYVAKDASVLSEAADEVLVSAGRRLGVDSPVVSSLWWPVCGHASGSCLSAIFPTHN
jgi:hypothetical protein